MPHFVRHSVVAHLAVRYLAIVAVITLLLAVQVHAASTAEITVTSVADSVADGGACTLRAAIQAANTDAAVGGCAAGDDTDTILFAIPGGGPHTIHLQTALPAISESVVLDGYSQAGAQENTNAFGQSFNGTLMIVLDGSQVAQMSGLTITGGSSTVRGLVLNAFDTAITLRAAGSNTIAGNLIGIDATGASASGNSTGVLVESSNNSIGGSDPAARNVISGNTDGVTVQGEDAFFNSVQGNLIGTDASGAAAVGNTRSGVYITDLTENNTVDNNVISGNGGWGILVEFQASNTIISSNWIGTNAAGDDVGNAQDGILARNSGPQIIGGTFTQADCCEGNTIAYNGESGVAISAVLGASWFKGILSNRIYANEELGIDLGEDGVTPNDPGDVDGENDANHLQNFPVLDEAQITGSTITISGTLNSTADTQFRLEFFANDACDASGYGEGQRYLGADDVTTQADGNVDFTVSLTVTTPSLVVTGDAVSATATTATGDTSEFSQCVQATGEAVDLARFLYLPLAIRE